MAKKIKRDAAITPPKLTKPGVSRDDGWNSVVAGLGQFADKTQSIALAEYPFLSDQELTNVWMGEGVGKKIVSAMGDDMTRKWFNVEEDTDNKIHDELTRLNAQTEVNLAVKWARLYRGAIIIVGVKDGGTLEQPLKKNITGIDWLRTYPAPCVPILPTDIETNPKKPNFGEPKMFYVQPAGLTPFRVHPSRCLIFKGEPIAPVTTGLNYSYTYWGMSVLQSIWEKIKNLGSVDQSIANIMLEFVISVYKLSNLEQLLLEGDEGVAAVYKRMEVIQASKSAINGVLLGAEEEFSRNTANVAGMAELLNKMMTTVAAVAEYPNTRLWGVAPEGMNATGNSDLRNYYDAVVVKQGTWLTPPVQTLVNMINTYIPVTPKGTDPTIKWNSVWELTETEELANRKTQAEIDKIYATDIGAITDDEVRESRFVNGYSYDTNISGDLPEPTEPPAGTEE